MMKFSEAQSKSIHKQAERLGEEQKSSECKHHLQKSKCEECSKQYHHDEKSEKEHGKEKEKTAKDQYHKEVRDLDEDKKTLPVFKRTGKGLKFIKHKQS